MPIAIFQQTVARTFLWIVLISMDVVGPLIFLLRPQEQWIYVAWLVLSLTAFAYLWLLKNDALITDLREICLYDVLVNCLALGLFISGQATFEIHRGLSAVIFFLKYARLVWPYKTAEGKNFSAWPVFGVLSFIARRSHSSCTDTAPSQTQARRAYLLIFGCLLMGFAVGFAGIEVKLAYFCIIPLLLAPTLYKRTQAEIVAQHARYQSAENAKHEAEKAAEKSAAKAEADRLIAEEKERSNQLLAAKNAELERANTSISELLADREKDKATLEKFNAALRDAAHDLQHPMAVVRLYGNALIEIDEQENQDSVAREIVAQKLTAAMEEMADMIDATIHSAQVVTGIIKPALRVIDMNALLKDFEIQWFEGPNRAGLDRLITYPRRIIKLFAVCDLLILKRILRNLIANAIQHSGADGRVLLVLRQVGDHCLVQVRDSGRGIEEGFSSDKVANFVAFTQRIHKEGSQVKEAGKRIGYRLGMHNVLQLCKATELTMQLCAKPERGSMFAFLLPLATAEQCVETRQIMAEEDRDLDEIIALMEARNDIPMPTGDFFPKDDSRYYHHQSRSNLANGEVSTPEK